MARTDRPDTGGQVITGHHGPLHLGTGRIITGAVVITEEEDDDDD